jgi:hypothetical protein
MIGELPVLLQDLSQSKLLLKFKQQESSITTTATPNDTTANSANAPAAEPTTSSSQKSSITNVAPQLPLNNRELSNVSNLSAGTKSITSESPIQSQKQRISSISNQSEHTITQQHQSKSSTASASPQANSKTSKAKTSIDNTSSSNTSLRSKLDVPKSNKISSTSKLTPLSSGIYGVEDSLDSGVYGADTSTLVNTKPSSTPPTKANYINNKSTPPNGRNETSKEEITNIKQELNNLTEKNNQDDVNLVSKTLNNNTTPRKTAFNPLHVILKDKNKYHTTEYI